VDSVDPVCWQEVGSQLGNKFFKAKFEEAFTVSGYPVADVSICYNFSLYFTFTFTFQLLLM
jgi:hypothetical protein